ncbi:MAG: TetR/AcrR family transcriptional regulator [Gammaproteobacteria bacterium]
MSTKDKIVKSAVTLFIHQGVAKTTTKQIAASASVAEGSIYRYFPSKDELAWQVFKDYHQYLAMQLQQSTSLDLNVEEKIYSLVSSFLKLADEDWLMFRYYLTSLHTHMQKVTEDMLTPYRVLANMVEESAGVEEIKVTDDINVITAMMMGAVHQIAINKIYSRIDGDLYVHRKLVSNILLNMIKIEGDSNE